MLCFLDLKFSVWFSLGSENETMFSNTLNFLFPLSSYPRYQRFFHACEGELRFVGHRPTRFRPKAEDRSGEDFLRLDRNRKPPMKSFWYPGYFPLYIERKPFTVKLIKRPRSIREQSNFTNLVIQVVCSLYFYFDELSIYKWTEPWNVKGSFPESWGLRASVFSSPLPLPLTPFFFASALTFVQ